MVSRRPIDISILTHLVLATKAVIADAYMKRAVAAMFLLAFQDFLGIGEITLRQGVSPGQLIHYSDVDIGIGEITLRQGGSPAHLIHYSDVDFVSGHKGKAEVCG